jgi:hypothetical protein
MMVLLSPSFVVAPIDNGNFDVVPLPLLDAAAEQYY